MSETLFYRVFRISDQGKESLLATFRYKDHAFDFAKRFPKNSVVIK